MKSGLLNGEVQTFLGSVPHPTSIAKVVVDGWNEALATCSRPSIFIAERVDEKRERRRVLAPAWIV